MAVSKDRIDRLAQLEALIPRHAPVEDCPDPGRLVDRMGKHYAHHASPAARRRAIQRDLEELVADARIEPVNRGGKPLRYRRLREDTASDPYLWDYARRSIDREHPRGRTACRPARRGVAAHARARQRHRARRVPAAHPQ